MNNQRSNQAFRLPLFCKVVFPLTALSVALYIGFTANASFADFFNRTVSSVGRFVLAKLTAWLPFSLAEMLILLLPAVLIAAIVVGYSFFAIRGEIPCATC